MVAVSRTPVWGKSKWLHNPCFLRVPKMGRNGYTTPIVLGVVGLGWGQGLT